MKRSLLLGGAVLFGVVAASVPAHAVLLPGDVAIVGYNFDDADELAIVALENLPAGESIKFTDNGWFASQSFRTGEGIATFTVPAGGISAGTIVNVPVGAMQFSTSGDQILAYQGLDATPTFIFALNSDGATWAADATSSNNSSLPPSTPNIAIPEVDNAIFNVGTLATGTKADWLTAISNTSNWTTNDTTRFTMPSGSITVTGAAPPPPPSDPGTLVITGIVDGDLTGGVPKIVEVFAKTAIPDLSIFSLGIFANGAGTATTTSAFPAGSLAAGEFLYLISSGSLTDFNAMYPGETPIVLSAVNANGDDAYQLLRNLVVVDAFGVVGLDGSGEPWEYTDSFAFRLDGFGPNTTFTLSEWTFGGIAALDGLDRAGHVNALANLIGSFDAVTVPEPASMLLLTSMGSMLLWRRRRAA